MRLLCLLLLSGAVVAQTANRNVDLSWTASTTTGVNGYNIYRCVTTCTPAIGTPLNAALVTSTNYVDATAVVGTTYTYSVTAVAAACTATTPVGTPCGESALSTPATTTVPPQPAVTISVTISVP
jgi:hypothetical protein